MEFNLNKFKERALTLDSIGLLYILIVGGLCQVLPIPEIVKGFLALPGFLIIPYLFSKGIFPLIKKNLNIDFDFDIISRFVIHWCLGVLSILLFALLLYSFNLFNIYLFVVLLLIIIGFAAYSNSTKERYYSEKIKDITLLFGGSNIILLLIFFGIVPSLYVSYFTPFPLSSMTDVFNLNRVTLQVIEDNTISLTGGYLPVQWLISAIIALFFNADPFSFSWTSKFLFYTLYPIGIYLFIYALSKNIKLSLISALISVWITPYSVTLYHFLPRVILYVLFPFFLFLIYKHIIKNIRKKDESMKNIFLLSISISLISLLFFFISYASEDIGKLFGIAFFIFLLCTLLLSNILLKDIMMRKIFFILFIISIISISIHIPMGSLIMFLIILYLLISSLLIYYPTKTKIFISILFFFILLFLFLQKIDVISMPAVWIGIMGYDSSSIYNTPTFSHIYAFIINTYSSPIVAVFIGGMIFAIINKKQKDFSLIFLASIIFLFSFLPIHYMYRILFASEPFAIYFVAYLITISLDTTLKNISKKYKSTISLFYTFLIIIILINLIMTPQLNLTKSHTFNMHEYNAFKWLKSNAPKDTIILSEKQTMIQANGIANKIMLNPLKEYESIYEKNIFDILTTTSAYTAYNNISFLFKNESIYKKYPGFQRGINTSDRKVIIVIGPKTSYFAMHGPIQWAWYTRNFKHFNGLDKFFSTTYFTLLYNDSNQIYIFGANPEPGVPFELKNQSK